VGRQQAGQGTAGLPVTLVDTRLLRIAAAAGGVPDFRCPGERQVVDAVPGVLGWAGMLHRGGSRDHDANITGLRIAPSAQPADVVSQGGTIDRLVEVLEPAGDLRDLAIEQGRCDGLHVIVELRGAAVRQ